MMKAFDFLDSIRTMEFRIQIKTRQAQHLRDTMSNITAPMDKEQVSHTKNVSALQDTMAMVLDIENEIKELRSIVSKRQKEVLTLLDQMNAENANILSCRFIEGKSLKELGKIVFLSRRQTERRLNDALDEFQNLLNQTIPEEA